MKVFRVEHSEETYGNNFAGPYGVSNFIEAFRWTDRIIDSTTHPIPKDDIQLPFEGFNPNFICGFKSFQDLTNWFNWTELQTLKELGFVIAEYETKEVYAGSKQLVFIPEGERTITPISVYNYYKS
jgi:hypothetical protein